jgi:uracil phosphoribosyltransferase
MTTEIEHKYGTNIHILNDPFATTVLAQLGSPDTFQPKLNTLITFLYRRLLEYVLNSEFSAKDFEIPTRMTSYYPDQKFRGRVLDPNQKAVCVNLARAGTVPSHVCYEHLNYVLDPEGIRQDHVFAARITNANDQVTGTSLGNAKIGGGIDDAYVLFPDPMGATGNTLAQALSYYKNEIQGQAKKYIALHLIITPEYIRRLTQTHPDLKVYAIRLDRGFSTPEALKAVPGALFDQEKGLNERQYIVPGAGGLGEVLNNSFV